MDEHAGKGSWQDRYGPPAMLVVLGVAGALLAVAVAWPAGPPRLVAGRVESVRVPEIVVLYRPTHGRVRLDDGAEVEAALPDNCGCRPGDRIVVVDTPKLWGHRFQAVTTDCRRP